LIQSPRAGEGFNASRAPHIVIAGGGFGGVFTSLRRSSGRCRPTAPPVTLVNNENFSLYTPSWPGSPVERSSPGAS